MVAAGAWRAGDAVGVATYGHDDLRGSSDVLDRLRWMARGLG
ncbi:hypothetical protein LI90_955 [Carbonactinospora thermoautotrophica]|uniref:Uncharacterized protein n=1 Tax=Carbonactinospora thermoautotrophica TaxID=1469144 RepID=A0A132MPH2_9ACTN|nr:hypothetical protein [Carbonactinospora thermoautotrophica]KWW99321.1 hypothetical protein LI90_955 [Carbonactinospora thermoautotrophica]